MKLFNAFRRAYLKSKTTVIFYRYLSKIKRYVKMKHSNIRNRIRKLYNVNKITQDVAFSYQQLQTCLNVYIWNQ